MNKLKKYITTNFGEYLNENIDYNDNLSRHEKYQLLMRGEPIIVYRGIHESGKNFYKGDKQLPFTYYSLTKDTAKRYGIINKYIFNEKSLPIKIFRGFKLYDKFGINAHVEDNEVVETLKNEGYSGVFQKGDELVVYDDSLIKKLRT